MFNTIDQLQELQMDLQEEGEQIRLDQVARLIEAGMILDEYKEES